MPWVATSALCLATQLHQRPLAGGRNALFKNSDLVGIGAIAILEHGGKDSLFLGLGAHCARENPLAILLSGFHIPHGSAFIGSNALLEVIERLNRCYRHRSEASHSHHQRNH